MEECIETDINKYNTFCDFFTRKLKNNVHRIDNSKKAVVSSVMGEFYNLVKLNKNQSFRLKARQQRLMNYYALIKML